MENKSIRQVLVSSALNTTYYTQIHCMVIVLKDPNSFRVAKCVPPSHSLLKGPSVKVRERTTLTQRIGKLFTLVLSLPA